MKNKIMLSFDIEEFDFPRERGEEISLEDGVKRSSEGTEKILRVLKGAGVKATFFVTGNFAKTNPSRVRKMAKQGHETACHGVDHFRPAKTDPCESKKILEKTINSKVAGYRQPRMFKISYDELSRCGYKYDSSVNPAFVPGRYNNFKTPRRPYKKGNVTEIPVSAAGVLRIPLFWLALHNFPKHFYLHLAKKALRQQGYFTTYFHPWEFTCLKELEIVPWYIKRNSNDALADRLRWLIERLKRSDAEFVTYSEFLEAYEKD